MIHTFKIKHDFNEWGKANYLVLEKYLGLGQIPWVLGHFFPDFINPQRPGGPPLYVCIYKIFRP